VDEISPRDFSMLETTNAHVKNAKFDPRIILRGYRQSLWGPLGDGTLEQSDSTTRG